jgi:hypothetical protein
MHVFHAHLENRKRNLQWTSEEEISNEEIKCTIQKLIILQIN